ncbi:unnamed protein product [Scytosiphon promiscuus]
MQMLQATHLLLEQPNAPMAVFLALDPRLIIAAIADFLGEVPSEVKGLEYLDKIIHLPFCLPVISEGARLNLLEHLLDGDDNTCPKTLGRLRWFLQDTQAENQSVKSAKITPKQFDLIGKVKCGRELLNLVSNNSNFVEAWEKFEVAVARAKNVQDCEDCLEKLCVEVNLVTWPDESDDIQSEQAGDLASRIVRTSDTQVPSYGSPPEDALDATLVALPPLPQEEKIEDPGGASQPTSPTEPKEEENAPTRAISPDEKKAFKTLFAHIDAIPRRMKRVVNVYILQRSLVLGALETKEREKEFKKVGAGRARREMQKLRRRLVKWTILAEFWPFRLSCIIYEMKVSNEDHARAHASSPSSGEARSSPGKRDLVSVYGSRDDSDSVCGQICKHRHKINTENLYFSDGPEDKFIEAINKGEPINAEQVFPFRRMRAARYPGKP